MDIVNVIKDVGVTVAVIVFFMYRDLKFNTQLQTTLQSLVDAVNCINAFIAEESKENKEKE